MVKRYKHICDKIIAAVGVSSLEIVQKMLNGHEMSHNQYIIAAVGSTPRYDLELQYSIGSAALHFNSEKLNSQCQKRTFSNEARMFQGETNLPMVLPTPSS